jgi:hypothetical protein
VFVSVCDVDVHSLDLGAHTDAVEDLPTPSIINSSKTHKSRRKGILISCYRRKLQQRELKYQITLSCEIPAPGWKARLSGS